MSVNKLEFRIIKDADGADVHLNSMSLAASKSLVSILESLTRIIELTPNNEGIRIKIVDGSAKLIAEGSDVQIDVLESDFNEVAETQSTNKELVDNWRNIQSIITANGLTYEANIYKNSIPYSIINRIKTPKQFRKKAVKNHPDTSLVFLTGKLMEVGGKSPNIHITDKDEVSITINCEENDAIKVNKFLYQKIYLSAWGKQIEGKKTQYVFCDFYSDSNIYTDFNDFVLSIQNLEDDNKLVAIHEKLKSYLNEKNFALVRKIIKLFTHESMSASTLKTILVITKSFKENEKIKDVRDKMKVLLETKIGHKLT